MDDKIKLLADRLSRIHGQVTISKGRSGTHLRLACPDCLERFGAGELTGRHLYVNAEKYLGVGRYVRLVGTYNKDSTARCHKTNKAFGVTQLLSMKPIEERGLNLDAATIRRRVDGGEDRPVCYDAAGNPVAFPPGVEIPITQLPADHPALYYLTSRGFNPFELEEHMGVTYCQEEAPEDKRIRRYYKRLACGFKNTPQGRVIFQGMVGGLRKGWQGRILEAVTTDFTGPMITQFKHYWHPYDKTWVAMELKIEDQWVVMPGVNQFPYEWKPAKYYIGPGQLKTEFLLGYDAAVHWAQMTGRRLAVLCEGPLDAARVGLPGMAMMGKTIAPDQVKLIDNFFDTVVYIRDKGVPGADAWAQVRSCFPPGGPVELHGVDVPEGYEDAGETPRAKLWEIINSCLAASP